MKNSSQKFWVTWLFAILFALEGCNSPPKKEISDLQEPETGQEVIAILGTNDIHGTIAPQTLNTKEQNDIPAIPYEIGGMANLGSYVKILRSEFGNHLIWLDAGDEFQGSIESNSQQGAAIVTSLNALGPQAAAIGNHEFDFGLDALKTRMSEAHYPYLSANIIEKSTEKPVKFPNTYPHLLLTAGNLKIGVIGLSTLDTPRTTRHDFVKDFEFTDLQAATIRESKILRGMGANIILITAHVGLKCAPGRLPHGRLLRKLSDPQGPCEDQDELVQFLKGLPEKTVDAVVAGHSHQIVHHWVAGVPVIQGGAFGFYFNIIYLTYDWSQHKILNNQTRIEGPITVCEKIFKNQNDCNGDRPSPSRGRGALVRAIFHGKEIQPDPKLQALLKPILERSESEGSRVIGTAAKPVEHFRMGESPLGNLIADAIRQSAHTEFALVNSGGIRAPFKTGPITFGDIFRTMPFENAIATLKVTAKELKLILQIAESGSRGFPAVSGLKLRLIDPIYKAPFSDLDGTGKKEPWKANRILKVMTSDGEDLEDGGKLYTLATVDFLVKGGDDVGWAMSRIPDKRVQLSTGTLVRDAITNYIQNNTPINTDAHPLIDLRSPRLKFERPR